jgi:dolichol-phosphate mannosyltransferase
MDGTSGFLRQWAKEDRRIQVLELSRNFGHQAALTAGLDLCQGNAVVVMDGDLQDPPELVHEFLAKYREGYDIVYARRMKRQGVGIIKPIVFALFYRLMKKFIHPDLPLDVGDFRLMSREALSALGRMREGQRFIRGMVSWLGFHQTVISYERPARAAGETKYPYSKLFQLAWNGMLSFSSAPLRLGLFLGALSLVVGIAMGIMALSSAIFHWRVVPGWSSLVIINCTIGGSILMCLGLVGEYVARIYDELKNRPLYIVGSVVNLPVREQPERGVIAEASSAPESRLQIEAAPPVREAI